MKQRKPFLLRIDPLLFEALEGWAEQELRSVNGQIEFLLKQAVGKHRGSLPEPPSEPAEPPGAERDSP